VVSQLGWIARDQTLTAGSQLIGLGGRTIPHGGQHTRLGQIGRHGRSHRSQANKSCAHVLTLGLEVGIAFEPGLQFHEIGLSLLSG